MSLVARSGVFVSGRDGNSIDLMGRDVKLNSHPIDMGGISAGALNFQREYNDSRPVSVTQPFGTLLTGISLASGIYVSADTLASCILRLYHTPGVFVSGKDGNSTNLMPMGRDVKLNLHPIDMGGTSAGALNFQGEDNDSRPASVTHTQPFSTLLSGINIACGINLSADTRAVRKIFNPDRYHCLLVQDTDGTFVEKVNQKVFEINRRCAMSIYGNPDVGYDMIGKVAELLQKGDLSIVELLTWLQEYMVLRKEARKNEQVIWPSGGLLAYYDVVSTGAPVGNLIILDFETCFVSSNQENACVGSCADDALAYIRAGRYRYGMSQEEGAVLSKSCMEVGVGSSDDDRKHRRQGDDSLVAGFYFSITVTPTGEYHKDFGHFNRRHANIIHAPC